MNSPAPALARLCRHVRVRPRLFGAIALGLLLLALPTGVKPSTHWIAAWLGGAGLYLALAWQMMWRADLAHMKWRARLQDDGATTILLLTIAAALASLAAIAIELHDLKDLTRTEQGLHVALVIATFAVSWLLIHTAFALHYAHAYYMGLHDAAGPPLGFPNEASPLYTDFLYFAIVIGMTSQTADVAIGSSRLRRLVMLHGLVAFVFNTTLLALTINMVAGVLG